MTTKKRLAVLVLAVLTGSAMLYAQESTGQRKDSVELQNVTVTGKTRTQRLREGALSVNAIDVRSKVSTIGSLTSLVDRTAGVKVREDGGVGSDFDLSINGMSGNSVRYFIDGMPLDMKGSGVTLANLPVSLIDHIEIYKGVVPTQLNSDALGGAVNIVTHRKNTNYLDASYGIGSFHTHRGNLNGQVVLKNGLTIRPTFAISYSKNDYMMKDVEVWNEWMRQYVETNRRRFHDDYRSILGQLEVGFTDKWWTDAFFVSASFNKVDKDIQTAATQSKVVGMADRTGKSWNLAASYQKRNFLIRNLSANLSLSHTWDHSLTTDTAYRKYDWNGDYIHSSRNEINGRGRTMRHYKKPLTIAKADLSYSFSEQHLLSLNYSLSHTGNDRWDDVDESFTPANDVLTKHIIGLTYNQSLLGGRLNNTLFLKDYVNHLRIEQTDIPTVTNSREVQGSNTNAYLGGGIGTRFILADWLAVKASYERSIRLPLARELLGNGTTIYANVVLEPEKSNNLNLGFFGTWQNESHTFYYEAGGFMRYVDNYIQPQVSEKEGMMQYVNVPAVRIKGLEAELRYNWLDRLQVQANVSWQDARNRNRYKADGKESVTYNNHVPNRPWFFASAEAHYNLHSLFSEGDRLQIDLNYQWVHWFYLSWEGYGAKDTKARIPEKNVFGSQLTYSWKRDLFSVSLSCDNMFDRTVYDNYKLQKPGRAFYLKFRVLLQQK